MQINVKEQPNEAKSNAYLGTNYLYTGVYYDYSTDMLYFVDKPSNIVTGICNARRFLSGDLESGVLASSNIIHNPGISEATLLKMIAIVQKPELAKDLV